MKASAPSQLDDLKITTAAMSARQLRLILGFAFDSLAANERPKLLDYAREIAGGAMFCDRTAVKAIVLALTDAGHDPGDVARITGLSLIRIRDVIAERAERLEEWRT